MPLLNKLVKSNIIRRHVRLLSTESVGFIGLGNMGLSMAKNIKSKMPTVPLVVYDINKANIDTLVKLGATSANSAAEVASQCSVIVTMLPATQHVKATLLGSETSEGIFKNMSKGGLIIDSSTIDPLASRELSCTAASFGLSMIDAPVSGGVTGAAAGTLTFMVGGSTESLQRATPYLSAMGKNIVHCGDAGAGGVTKLCNNLSLAISMIGTCEALALGKRMGMDMAKLAGVMNTSTARCWSSDSYNPVPGIMPNVPSSRGYTGGFGATLMEKDLSLALNMALAAKARIPLGSSALQLYGLISEQGYGDKDFSVVYDFLTKINMPK